MKPSDLTPLWEAQEMEYYDIIARHAKSYGWIPIIETEGGQEIYRGEFQKTAEAAFARCQNWIRERGLTKHEGVQQ